MRVRVHDGRLDRAALGRAVLKHCPYALLPLDTRELLTFDTTAWPWSTAPAYHDLTTVHRFLGEHTPTCDGVLAILRVTTR